MPSSVSPTVRSVSRDAESHHAHVSAGSMIQGPLAGRYAAVATMVMFALIPYLALSAALGPLTPIISKQLHMSAQTFSLGAGLANAAYALGTVLQCSLLSTSHRRLAALQGEDFARRDHQPVVVSLGVRADRAMGTFVQWLAVNGLTGVVTEGSLRPDSFNLLATDTIRRHSPYSYGRSLRFLTLL